MFEPGSNARVASRLCRAAGPIAVGVGAAVILGWILGIEILTSIWPGLSAMQPNTAAGFILIGASLSLLATRPASELATIPRMVARACAGAAVVVGALTLVEYATGWDLAIDRLLMAVPAGPEVAAAGRMGLNTATCFAFVGIALVRLDDEGRSEVRSAEVLAIGAMVLATVALLGYLYSLSPASGIRSYTRMALHTAVLFELLTAGILCARPDRGLMAIVRSQYGGGHVARRVVPAVVALPILVSWFRLQAERAGWYGTEFGLALFATTNIFLLCIVVLWTAASLNRTDGERARAERELRLLNQELERRVRERTAELEAVNKELEAFTYSVAHDLRAPLRQMDAFSNVLERQCADVSSESRHYLDRIREGASQMGQLIDDLLKLARIGRSALTRQQTDLDALVRETIDVVMQDHAGRAIEWVVKPLPPAACDPALMKVVLVNLLSNAAKFTRPRERAVIEVGATVEEDQTRMYVRDNGVGFKMKYAHKLFGVFQRLHRQEDFEGTGIGLATVQRIVHKHGGRVWAEAEEGQGATFFFTLGVPGSARDTGA